MSRLLKALVVAATLAAPVAPVAPGALGAHARTPKAAGLDAIAARVFACPPVATLPPPEKGGVARPKTKRHRVAALGLSLRLPRSWKPPVAPTALAAEASSPDGRTTVRVTVERLGELSVADAVARHEGRSFGPSTASERCAAALLLRYGRQGPDEVIGVYRSRLGWKGQTTTWSLYARRGGALVTLSVEARWTDRHPPEHGAVDAILAGLRWDVPVAGSQRMPRESL